MKNTGTRPNPHQSHGNKKTKFLTHESIYWVNINDDIKHFIKKLYYMSCISADTIKG